MAEQVIINKSVLTEIGNAIREKKGTTALIPTTEMANEIADIQTGGGDFGGIPLTIKLDSGYWSFYGVTMSGSTQSSFGIGTYDSSSTQTIDKPSSKKTTLSTGEEIRAIYNNVYWYVAPTSPIGVATTIKGKFIVKRLNTSTKVINTYEYSFNKEITNINTKSVGFYFPYNANELFLSIEFEPTE